MAKHKKRGKYTSNNNETDGSSLQIYPEATLTPDASSDKTRYSLLSEDTTNAPNIGEEDDESSYAGTTSALLDKYFFSKKYIPFYILLIINALVSAWIYISDNSSHKLNDFDSIKWTLTKCGIFFLLSLVFWILLSISQWIGEKCKRD